MIRLKPVSHHTSAEFKAVDAEERDCRFSNEFDRDSSMFNEYKHAGCLFECSLKFAITKAKCIPWDYPLPAGLAENDFELCTSFKNGSQISNLALFHQRMDSKDSMAHCKCIPDCEKVTYEPQVCLIDRCHANHPSSNIT